MDDGGNVPLGLAVLVLQGGVEGAGEGATVDALAVVVHGLDDGALAVSVRGASLSLPGTAARLLFLWFRDGSLGLGGEDL